jgi:hypothetical protein
MNATDPRPLPPIAPGFDGGPFYYASLVLLEVLYLVDAQPLHPYLTDSGLELAAFEDGQGAAGFNFQMYTSAFPNGLGAIMEIELNVFVYPAGATPPATTFHDWVMGADQSKLIGSHRVHVPCDNDRAIEAGTKLYGEPKFKTQLIPNFPVHNSPGDTTWSLVCCDPDHPPTTDDPDGRKHAIYTCEAKLAALNPVLSNPAPITVYGTVTADGADKGKPIGARWNILHPFETYLLAATDAHRVALGYGDSKHPMQTDLKHIIGNATASVVRTTISPPAAIQSRTYWP